MFLCSLLKSTTQISKVLTQISKNVIMVLYFPGTDIFEDGFWNLFLKRFLHKLYLEKPRLPIAVDRLNRSCWLAALYQPTYIFLFVETQDSWDVVAP